VVYGQPSRRLVDSLVFRRLRARVDSQAKEITTNELVAQHLAEVGCICLEDVVDMLMSEQQLDRITAFIHPFQLTPSKTVE
jgi:hypothetical protein